MRDLYLVDGYNVIFWVPDVFGRDDLESSRKKLIDLLQDYGAHNNIEMIVVFDGMGTSTKVKKEVLSDSFAIVFTPSRMTADSYIEKESYIRRNEYRSSTLSPLTGLNKARSWETDPTAWLLMI